MLDAPLRATSRGGRRAARAARRGRGAAGRGRRRRRRPRPVGRAPRAGLRAGVEQRHLRDELLAAHAERVEGAEAHEVLGDLAADARARHEVGERGVRPRLPGGRRARRRRPPDGHRRAPRRSPAAPRAHLFDVGQPHAQRRAVVLDLEPLAAQVDVERQHREPEAPRVVEHHARRVEAHGLVVEDAGVELGRVVRLEPGRGVADDGEAGGVRLVEAVGGEAAELAEDLVGRPPARRRAPSPSRRRCGRSRPSPPWSARASSCGAAGRPRRG